MTSSLGVIVLYWGWYTYYSYDSDTLVYDDQTGTCLVITLVFLLLLLPVCLQYRSIELHLARGGGGGGHHDEDREAKRHHHHRQDRQRQRDRSPPPKYHESK